MTRSNTPSLHDALPIFLRAAADERQRCLGIDGLHPRERTERAGDVVERFEVARRQEPWTQRVPFAVLEPRQVAEVGHEDRKSTRLNSSHVEISYAVYCV